MHDTDTVDDNTKKTIPDHGLQFYKDQSRYGWP